MNLLQLEGQVDTRDQEIARLRQQVRQMDEALSYERIKNQAIESGIRELRSITMPLLRGLQKIHGLVDEMGIQEQVPVAQQKHSAIWEEWKRKLNSEVVSRFIDAMLTHGELDAAQLAVITRCGRSNVPKYIYKLNQANLINKNNGKFSLKQL